MDRFIWHFRRHNILNAKSSRALSQVPVALGWEPQMTVPWRPRMTIQAKILCAVAVSGFVAFAATSPVQALTTQECSAKYQAAKTAGTLAGQKWNDFRKANCGADATAATPAAAPAAAPAPAPAAEGSQEGSSTCGCTRRAVRTRSVSERDGSEIRQGNRRQGPHAHLRRPVQRQQDQQRQWRHEVDPEGRRLLQRVQQAS